MKFTCKSQELSAALGIVEKAITNRTSLPVLENIYLSLSGNALTLRGNDLELGIQTSILVQGSQDGSVLIKSKTLASIVSKLSHQTLEFTVDENMSIHIDVENRLDFNILGLRSDEYPVFPEIEQGQSLTLKAEDMQQLIAHTIFAVSFDETKQFLNGILIKSEGNSISFVATDGYRLSLKNHLISGLDGEFEVIAPYKVMNEFNKILQHVSPNSEFKMTISANQIAFKIDDTICVSRVIQGQFPDYRQVLPKESGHAFSVSRKQFLSACERASIIAFASNNVVRLAFEGEHLTLFSNAAGMGEFKESLGISRLTGQGEAKIAFNVRLILDSIKNLEMDDIRIEFNNELSPCVIRPVTSQDYTYIIMPIRTSDYQSQKSENTVAAEAV